MKKVTTFTAQIYVGLREQYTDAVFPIQKIEWLCQNYVNEIGWCVTVTPTTFFYKNGSEPGAIVGSIDYPRFPITKTDFKNRVMKLAGDLLVELKQLRVSIVFPDETIMLEKDDYDQS
jgi:hypothetical protein